MNQAPSGTRDTQLSKSWLSWIPHGKGTRRLWTSDFRGTRQCFHVDGRTKLAIKWHSPTSTACHILHCPASKHSEHAEFSNFVSFCRLLHVVTIYFYIRDSQMTNKLPFSNHVHHPGRWVVSASVNSARPTGSFGV